MKFSLLSSVTLAALALAASQASAADYAPPSGPGFRPYISLFGGASVLTKNPNGYNTTNLTSSFDYLMNNPGYIIGGAVGVDWGNQIRTELELSHARWSSDKYQAFTSGIPGSTFPASTSETATYLLGNAWFIEYRFRK